MFKDDYEGDKLDIIATLYTSYFWNSNLGKCEDTKEVIRSRKSKKDRQCKWPYEKGQNDDKQ
jgi:hypothetical protein